jgi:hypothetical protein
VLAGSILMGFIARRVTAVCCKGKHSGNSETRMPTSGRRRTMKAVIPGNTPTRNSFTSPSTVGLNRRLRTGFRSCPPSRIC